VRSRAMRRVRFVLWNLLPPLTFVAMVFVWWAAVEGFKIPAYLLPGPEKVFTRLVTDAALLWTHSKVTLTEILPRVRLQAHDNAAMGISWRTGYEHDTVISGRPVFASDDTLITPERPLLYHEVFWVVNGCAFKATFQGVAENLPLFHRVVDSITFPDAPRVPR